MEGVERFADPWEHLRLLSDPARNDALLALLRRRAPGARVLEIGCGTGLWSCAAARMGATEVWAVEPTGVADVARELIAANGLGDRVHLIESTVEAAPLRPVDLAFSELLNADPFYEGVVEATEAASSWVVEGGTLAPRRLRVWAQLVRSPGPAREYRDALAAVRTVGETLGLRVDAVIDGLREPGPYGYVTGGGRLASDAVLLWDLALGTGAVPDPVVRRTVTCPDPGPVAGALLWFEAELDDGIVMSNRPGARTHWGQAVHAWPHEVGVGAGGQLDIVATLEGDAVSVALAPRS